MAAAADADASYPLSHTSPNMALGSSSSADAVPAPCDNDHFLCPNLLTRGVRASSLCLAGVPNVVHQTLARGGLDAARSLATRRTYHVRLS